MSSASSLQTQKSSQTLEAMWLTPNKTCFTKKNDAYVPRCIVSFCLTIYWTRSMWASNPTRVTGENPFTSVVSGVDSCEQTASSFSSSYSFSPQPNLSWLKGRECTTTKWWGSCLHFINASLGSAKHRLGEDDHIIRSSIPQRDKSWEFVYIRCSDWISLDMSQASSVLAAE